MGIQSRRKFLATGARLAGAGIGLGRFGMMNATAQTSGDYRALVCIFMFGGNDSNNMIVPKDQRHAAYASVRAGLTIPQANLLSLPSSSGEYGLHPNLSAIHPLYAAKKMAVLANVGVLYKPTTKSEYNAKSVPIPSNLFSHSDQQQQWQTGHFDYFRGTGWAGRTADAVAWMNNPSKFPTAVSMAGNSVMLTGSETKPAVLQSGTPLALTGTGGTAFLAAREAAMQEIINLHSGLSMVQQAGFTLKDGLDIGKLIEKATASAPTLQTQFPNTSLGRQLTDIARLVAVRGDLGMRRQIFFASIGGFDTHSNQLTTHANLMTQLAEGIAAIQSATEELGVANSVVTFTESEFGRTFQPSAGAGSDHAWGSHHMIFGAPVKGGQLYGTFPEMALGGPDDVRNRGSWIPTTSLDQYGATLASWFGVPPAEIDAIFPNLANFPVRDLGLLS